MKVFGIWDLGGEVEIEMGDEGGSEGEGRRGEGKGREGKWKWK